MKKALLVLSTLLLAAASPACAQEDVAAFYKGKTMRIVVGVGVGSGYDINARLLARHLAAHIPGQPTIVVQNQPGAGSLTMTNALYNTGPFDGTVMGASFNGMPTTPLLQPTGVRFDPVKLNWLGSTNREPYVAFLWHAVPVHGIAELTNKQVTVGSGNILLYPASVGLAVVVLSCVEVVLPTVVKRAPPVDPPSQRFTPSVVTAARGVPASAKSESNVELLPEIPRRRARSG